MAKDKPDMKFNRGDVAEGILGAALTAKFINRPKSLKDKNVLLTKKMIDDVLDEFFAKADITEFKRKDIVASRGKIVFDKIQFYMGLTAPATTLLSKKASRYIVDDLYDSAITYIEDTWTKEVLSFALNGQIDTIQIDSDGIGDQKGTKADIKIKINGKDYKRQISLKVKGGDQFAQVGGGDFSKQKVLWNDILDLDIDKLEKAYNNALADFDKTELFSSREDKKIEKIKEMMKEAVGYTYKEAAKQMTKKVASKDSKFFNNLAKLIFEGATRGNETIELVKLEKGKFKQLKFNNDFLKLFASQLKKSNLKVVYVETGIPTVRFYANTATTQNLILQIRPKLTAESRTTKAGKVYSPYLRNIFESGPLLFNLLGS